MLSYNYIKRIQLMYYSTKLLKKPQKLIEHKTEINVDDNPDILKYKNVLPARLLRQQQSLPEDLYLIDEAIGKTISIHFKNRIKIKNATVIDVNPGLGLITKHLVNKYCTYQIFEANTQFANELKQLYRDKLNVFVNESNFFSIWKQAYQDRFDNGRRVKDMLINVNPKPWLHDPSMKIIGVLTNINFIKHLIYTTFFQNNLAAYGRCEMLLVMSPAMYYYITATSESSLLLYRATSVLAQLIFDIKLIQKFPRKSFLPWQLPKKNKKDNQSENINELYLVHIVHKKHLPVPVEQLQPLWYFVRHHMTSRRMKVIPQLERWIPDCGTTFILSNKRNKINKFKNINIYTTFGELNTNQILDIFKQFVALPEYPECPFIASMDNCFLKMETTDESDVDMKTSISNSDEIVTHNLVDDSDESSSDTDESSSDTDNEKFIK